MKSKSYSFPLFSLFSFLLESDRFDRDLVLKWGRRMPVEAIGPNDWRKSISYPDLYYWKLDRFFCQKCPQYLVKHREYFSRDERGFGEDAFVAMWYLLFEKFQFKNFLEIGVYRGQVLSLLSLMQKMADLPQNVTGISPLEPVNDSVSTYTGGLNYEKDILNHFDYFQLDRPRLVKALSQELRALEEIKSKEWDCIYIDGGHDYEVVKQDWLVCSQALKPGGIIVLDDASLFTKFTAVYFGFKGHPGPSRVCAEINRNEFEEILQVGHNRVFRKLSPDLNK